MTWHQLSVICNEQVAEEVSDFFSELGAVSVTFQDGKDQPIYEPDLGDTKIWQQTKVIGLFEITTQPKAIKSLLFSHFKNSCLTAWFAETIQDQVWERSWMQYYQPMKFADKLWVCPTGQEKQELDTVCMTLDPGLAFGTGTHPTTALCLEWLANQDLNNKIIIDYGCGSGILAVAALLLGAKKAYAIDIDPQAITATIANAEKNQVENKISCHLAEHFSVIKADIVIANILAKPLIQLAQPISSLIKPSGQLILSGILNEQANSVISAYQPFKISMHAPTSHGEWCRLNGINSI